jgi:hypothetical protein
MCEWSVILNSCTPQWDYTRVDESFREALIKDECESSQWITHQQLDALSVYLKAMKQLIETSKKDHVNELRPIAKRLPDDRRDEFWQWNYPWQWDDVIATQFYESFVILAVSVFERNINLFCRDTGIVAQTKVELNDLRSSLLERASVFLQRLVGFQRPTTNTWEKLKKRYEVRNALVHYGDYVEPIQLQNRLAEFLQQAKGINVVQGFVYISSEFCQEVYDTIQGCFTELHEEQRALCQRVHQRVSKIAK